MDIRREITLGEYLELRKLTIDERYKRIEHTIPPEWVYGYGYYGNRVEDRNGKYYIVHDIGNTCD